MKTTDFTILEQILAIPNIKVTNLKQNETEIHLYIEFTNEFATCPNCGAECDIIHEKNATKHLWSA